MASDLPTQIGWAKSGAKRKCEKKKSATHNAEKFRNQIDTSDPVFLDFNAWNEEELFTIAFDHITLAVLQLTGCTRLSDDVGGWMNVLANALNQPGCKVRELHLDRCRLTDKEIQIFAEVLETGECRLSTLDLGHNSIGENGVKYLSQALQSEKCGLLVLELMFNKIEDKGAEHLSAALKNPTCQLLSLGLYGEGVMTSKGTSEILKALPSSRLTHLNIGMHHVNVPLVIDAIGPALHHLKCLSCPAVHSLDELKSPKCTLELLQFGYWVNSDNWNNKREQKKSPLEHFGDIIKDVSSLVELDIGNGETCCGAFTYLLAIIAENYSCPLEVFTGENVSRQLVLKCQSVLQHNENLRKVQIDFKAVKPSYAAKLFVCGNSGVGKTTFTLNLNKKINFDCLQRHISTEGIHMRKLAFGKKTVVIYDVAGQSEYHTFHHYFIHGSDRDAFLVVCKVEKNEGQDNLEEQLHYWLRFIAAHRASPMTRPRVIIGLNFWDSRDHIWSKPAMLDAPITRTESIRVMYKDVLDFGEEGNENLFGFVATKPNNLKLAKERINCITNALLEGRNIPTLCDKLIPFLRQMRTSTSVILVRELMTKVKKAFRAVRQEVIESALLHLHDMGEVVYLDITDSKLPPIVILDVKWFNQDVIRLFINNEALRIRENSGSLRTEDILMELLTVNCREKYRLNILHCLNIMGVLLPADDDWAGDWSSRPRELIIPTLLTNKCALWADPQPETDEFWGRRYSCEDTKTTLLPSGLFSMLQSRLEKRHRFQAEDIHDQGSYNVGNGWIKFEIHKIVFIIRIGGPTNQWTDHHWIDVFMKISEKRLKNEASKLFPEMQDEVFRTCNNQKLGCPHLKLVEEVIDPKGCQQLTQENCTVPLATIKLLLSQNGINYKYKWNGDSETSIEKLLLPSESIEYGKKMSREIESIRIEAEIEAPGNNNSNVSFSEGLERGRFAACSEQQLGARLLRVEEAVLNLSAYITEKQMQLLRQCQEATVRLLSAEYPRLPYFKSQENWSLIGLVGGKRLKLHALCEGKIPHEVVDQKGVTVNELPKWLRRVAPALGPVIKLLWLAIKMTTATNVQLPGKLPTLHELGLPELQVRSWKSTVASLPHDDTKQELHQQLKELYDQAFKEADPSLRDNRAYEVKELIPKYFNLHYEVEHAKGIWVCDKCKKQ